ncbi:MAG TPA: hypothetical protein VFH15_14805 [Pyrinomonadaceae bacterium]|nr:hypothetical protein [Pyrinomonadaceae bacterium]
MTNKRVLPKLCSVLLALVIAGSGASVANANAQRRRAPRPTPQASHASETMSAEARELVERAIDVACKERRRDPKGSVPIDEMQGRPSLPVRSAEAIAGSARAQRLLPLAKDLVIESLNRLATEYKLSSRSSRLKLQQAIQRVRLVRRIRPDMDSRDNASVLMRNPVTITFGTIFLAGLPSDEAMISVLGHELVHIADGDHEALQALYRAVGKRASSLTGLDIRAQRAEELTCDVIGALAARKFVTATPDYDPLARRVSRAVAHNCVVEDEGDEDHLSPRNTIRALLSLNPALTQELVYGREERE